jgi:hypothetical protein
MFASTAPKEFCIAPPEYDHTQWGPMYWLLVAPGLIALFVAAQLTREPAVVAVSLFTAVVTLVAAFSFRSLRILDEGNAMAIRFGALPIFRKRINYADIASAERDRSTIADGWGIHWVPGRGWTYNLWGMDCVRVTLRNGTTIRVGTDDPDGLAAFLDRKRSAPT